MSMYIPSNEIISESARRKIIPSNPLDYNMYQSSNKFISMIEFSTDYYTD
jgi:hypothetical protein